jgi:hypothetical protein
VAAPLLALARERFPDAEALRHRPDRRRGCAAGERRERPLEAREPPAPTPATAPPPPASAARAPPPGATAPPARRRGRQTPRDPSPSTAPAARRCKPCASCPAAPSAPSPPPTSAGSRAISSVDSCARAPVRENSDSPSNATDGYCAQCVRIATSSACARSARLRSGPDSRAAAARSPSSSCSRDSRAAARARASHNSPVSVSIASR